MTNKTQKSEPRRGSLIPILIVGSIVAVLCLIAICVLLILLILPAFGVESFSSGAASQLIEVGSIGLATLTLNPDGFVFGMFDPVV